MSGGGEHPVIIERHGRSHRARCGCGWAGHAWNELRPAEADAWHHCYGDSRMVDISAISDPADDPAGQPTLRLPVAALRQSGVEGRSRRTSATTVDVTARARALADQPSPYGKHAADELWLRAAQDRRVLEAAVTEISELLRRHSQHNASTADSEWLQLITAKRLLQEALEQHGGGAAQSQLGRDDRPRVRAPRRA